MPGARILAETKQLSAVLEPGWRQTFRHTDRLIIVSEAAWHLAIWHIRPHILTTRTEDTEYSPNLAIVVFV